MGPLRTCAMLVVLGLLGGSVLADPTQTERDVWSWPDRATTDAVSDGLLVLEAADAPEQIATYQRIDLRIRIRNRGDKPLWVPHNWPARIGAEIVALDDPNKVLTWQRPVRPSGEPWQLEPGQPGWLATAIWFASEPLQGLDDKSPCLPPGRYKWRPVLWGNPPIRGEWTALEVLWPKLSAEAQQAARRRPEGRLLLVSPNRQCPSPTGTADRPFGHVADALRLARAGDVVFCEPGRHVTGACVVGDDVWLLGAGAACTVVDVSSHHVAPNNPHVKVDGKARLEGLTLRAPAGRGTLLYCAGEESRPSIHQCVLIPADGSFSALTAWDMAAPVLTNCLIVSPVGDYGVFARNGARPTVEYCTIISRGFGVGMMDRSVPTIRRCIIAGRCPAVISDDGEFALSDSVIFCPRPGGGEFTYPILRGGPAAEPGTYKYQPMLSVLQREDILSVDPRFVLKGELPTFFSLQPDSPASRYGAFAGSGGTWPAGTGKWPGVPLPNLAESGLLILRSTEPARTVKLDFRPADPPAATTYVLSAYELANVRARVVELLADPRPVTLDDDVRYSSGISHFDNWLPAPGEPIKSPPVGSYYRWGFVASRVAKVEFFRQDKPELQFTVRFNELGAPVLCVNHAGAGIGYVILADYDSRGLLCRLVYLSKSLEPVRVEVFENEIGYASTTHWSFTPQGKFIARSRNAGDDLFHMGPDNVEKRVNGGSRLWWIQRLERYGLASFYPTAGHRAAAPDSAGQPPPPPPAYDPDAVRLEIVSLVVNRAAVEEQVSGNFTVRNVGGAFEIPANVVNPGYGVFILDVAGKVLFRNFGGIGGPFAAGREVAVGFITSSNSMEGTPAAPFIIPKPGAYILQVVFYRTGDRKSVICERSMPFTVK